MYRLLEVGEVIENGDEYYGIEGKWLGFPPSCFGMKSVPHDAPIRRLVKGCKNKAVQPAAPSVPDPGEGWRLLEVGETELAGDQYWDDCDNRWLNAHFGGSVYDEHDRKGQYFLRRRIPQPAPVVSVGDRVKVLSGPWAGCTGVVVGSLPMNLKIKMDNVFVGGNNLTMIVGKTSSVEPLPPVVPEVIYRDLAIGETILGTDQHIYNNWETVNLAAGQKVDAYHCRIRRPVRVQSPGWRYLDAGETVQSGDETEYCVPPYWRCASGCSSYLGRVFEGHDKFFRRKLPSNQGG